MTAKVIQASFNSGEWSPNLWLRTDLEKYHSGAALLRNFFVDYRGGASTRFGTRYCLRGYIDGAPIRLIPFQATFQLGYALEFGDHYIRFYQDGSPILESGLTITGITNANPAIVTVANSYTPLGVDWIFISGVNGMGQINGKYYKVATASGSAISLEDLFGNPVDSTSWGTYTGGGTTQRVYTLLNVPYAAADLALLKFAQNVTSLVICHPNYPPNVLTFFAPTNWTIVPISFGTTIGPPVTVNATTTLGSGNTFYSYVVTAVDGNGQESLPSGAVTLSNLANFSLVAGTNTISWSGVNGASSYNVYRTNTSQFNPAPVGVPFGFIGSVTGTSISDTNITPEFTITPPIDRNPFITGFGVQSCSITAPGTYTTAPSVIFQASPFGDTASGFAVLTALSGSTGISSGGTGYAVNDTVLFPGNIVIQVTSVGGGGNILTSSILNTGSATVLPTNPLGQIATSGAGTGAQLTANWGVFSVTITNSGQYSTTPNVVFSPGPATAVAIAGATGSGNPSVPAFFQQRLCLAAPASAPQTMYFSQPGFYYNFNISSPVQADDAITASIISGQLNSIKAMINQPAGLIVLTDGSSWLVNGGSFGSAITPASIVANAQSFNGANDMPPIIVVFDILYVQSKGSKVRDSLYNFYANVYTGTDISIYPSHLFFGFTLKEWAFAEEPFNVVWAVRNDGTLLALTFLKEQDFIAWTHHDTLGTFQSVCAIIESAPQGPVNALYTVVTRLVNGVAVKYIERMADRYMPNGVADAWTVDCGIQYEGSPVSSFQGAEFLSGLTVTGLADGVPITPFVMPASGQFTIPSPASKVTVGIAFTPQLQTLYLDTGKPTIQGLQKKIPKIMLRVVDTLGLECGTDFSDLVVMKDLIPGNVGSLTNQTVSGLVTGDIQTYLDPKWSDQGQICVQQNLPYPATILGVVQDLAVEGVK